MGISEGAFLLRAMLQSPACEQLKIASLISLGGPHGGVAALPFCQPLTSNTSGAPCRDITQLLKGGAYSTELQSHLMPAQFYRDPELSPAQFAEKRPFLARVNGLPGTPPEQNAYSKSRILALERMVLYRFANDTLMVPRDTSWFAYLDGRPPRTVQLWEQPEWAIDPIGLRALYESGRLLLLTAPGQHASFTTAWFVDNVARPFLF